MTVSTILLSHLKVGESAVIDGFTDDILKLKLLEMGCLPGEKVTVERIAPLGDPMAILIADSIISIRMDEADNVIVVNLTRQIKASPAGG